MTSNSEISEKEVEAAFRAFCDACQFRDGEEQYRDFDTEKAARPELYNFGMKGMRTALEAAALARAEANAGELSPEDENYLQEVADGAWGDDPRTRGLARDRLAAHPAPQPSGPVEALDDLTRDEISSLAKRLCPDCGREKAMSAADAARGQCPKWWAITDADAEKDCRNHVPQPSRPTRELIEAGLLRGDESCECGECTVEECNDCMMPDAAPQPSGPVEVKPLEWRERWYGSEPMRGWSIVQDRELVAYLGPEVDGKQVTAIVLAHNEAISALTAGKPVEAVFAEFAKKQERLRHDFEAAIFDNLEELYEGEPIPAGKPEQEMPSGWQPMETAPKDGTPVLLSWGLGYHPLSGRFEYGKWGFLGFDWGFNPFPTQPRYWLPLDTLPAAPTAGGGDA